MSYQYGSYRSYKPGTGGRPGYGGRTNYVMGRARRGLTTSYTQRGGWSKAASRYTRLRRYRNPKSSLMGWKNDGSELKSYETNQNSTCDTTGMVQVLNNIVQGDDILNRIGRQVTMQSVLLNLHLYPTSTVASSMNLARVMLVWDKSPNSTGLPGINLILDLTDSRSNLNLSNRDRFEIVWEKRWAMSETTAGSKNGANGFINEMIMLKNKKTTYSGVGGGITQIATNSLLLVTVGDVLLGQGTNVTGYSRVRFWD